MSEIVVRRIREREAAAAVELWDRMCREVRDGGPLSEQGRRNLRRMLEAAAWHRETFCLVAVRDGEVLGFGVGRLDPGDGLLPGAVGELQELYVPAEHGEELKRRLATAVIERLRADGPWTLRKLVAADEPGQQGFWASLGFEADMVVMSSYAREGGDC
jgi:L-amino acid N-acyltransferase YncA